MLILFTILSSILFAQEAVKVGGGSYASVPPQSVYGVGSDGPKYETLKSTYPNLHIDDHFRNMPVPSNDWFSARIFAQIAQGPSQWGGETWSYPYCILVPNDTKGFFFEAVSGFQGEVMIVDDNLQILGATAQPTGAAFQNNWTPTATGAYEWTDIGHTMYQKDGDASWLVTQLHGSVFAYVEPTNLFPIIHPSGEARIIDINGNPVTDFPATLDSFSIAVGKALYGVHLPVGSTVYHATNGDIAFQVPANSKNYLVLSDLPSLELLPLYDKYARNKPTDTKFLYDYIIEEGQIITTFNITTVSLEAGEPAGGETILSFLPHQWRTPKRNFEFIPGADYRVLFGTMHSAIGLEFTLTYEFGGLPPYLPAPPLTQAQKDHINQYVNHIADTSGGMDGNTYAKGLGERTAVMHIANAVGNTAARDTIVKNLKNQLQNWLTFDGNSEGNDGKYFFAKYPEYGALVGFPCGYGSQSFNDHHFHYGYLTVGAARVMHYDEDFKSNFGEITKLVVQEYANWEHYDPKNGENQNFFPFLRTFDPYTGHSWAGGTGDSTGNNQESTSEAINSWFGIYSLGVELQDETLIKLGAMGFHLETISAAEYWEDIYHENLPAEYPHKYVGVLRSGHIAFGTYFSGDAGWIMGIQAVPCDFFYQHFGLNRPNGMRVTWQQMLQDRGGAEAYNQINGMGAYLGGYHLNILQQFDPDMAVDFNERLFGQGGEWREHVNMATNYFTALAIQKYGWPAAGYHTSIASGAVYANLNGELTYILYNPSATQIEVKIYKGTAVIATVPVPPKEVITVQG